MTIKVAIKNVYGNDLVYPICDTAKLLAKLAGTKTLSSSTIQTLKDLGYVLEVSTPTL